MRKKELHALFGLHSIAANVYRVHICRCALHSRILSTLCEALTLTDIPVPRPIR